LSKEKVIEATSYVDDDIDVALTRHDNRAAGSAQANLS
jgi:hypothetical protein